MQKTNLTLTLACSLFASLFASSAHAHIRTTGALMSRGGDIKMDPCDGARGATVYTFAPGATISIAVNEYVGHPSYYRIAFSKDGNSKSVFVEPKSIKPVDPSRPCPIDANDKCGASDFCNVENPDGSGVLWDNLVPHLNIGTPSYTFTVTLPNVECDNCTVQVIQVMEDNASHGDYCPSDSCMDSSLEDIYHLCIDLKLVKGATNGPGSTTAPEMNMGMKCTSALGAVGGAGGASAGTGGASAGKGGASAGTSGAAAGTGGSSAAGTAGTSATGTAGVVGSAGASTGAAGSVATGVAGSSTTGTAGAASPTTTGLAGAPAVSSGGAAGTTGTTPKPAAKSGGCSVVPGSQHSRGAFAFVGMALGLAALRRRRRA